MNKRIAYLRSTSIVNDSRASKEINAYLDNGCEVIVVGWNRQNLELNNFTNKNKLKMFMYQQKSEYGSGLKNLFKLLKFNRHIYKTLKKEKNSYDIIHACDLDTAIAAYMIAKKYHKKLIYDIYDYYVDCHNLSFLKKTAEKIDINIMNKADCVIICTEQRRLQIKKANPKKLLVIHNTPNINEDASVKQYDKNKIKVCYVGILQNDRLLKEVALEIANNKNIELHIGGFGVYEDFLKNISEENSNIKFYGQMKYSDVLKLEAECDILFATYNPLIPNHQYSAPNKVYEAMALGKPIIVCNNTGVDELIKKEKIGYVIDYDASELVKIVNKISNKDVQQISKRTKMLYSNKYNWDKMSRQLIELIESMNGEV